MKQVIIDDVPGDLIETGVWRGGVAIFMRAILEAYDDRDRIVFAADSFEGLPPPDVAAFPADAGSRLHTADVLAVSRQRSRAQLRALRTARRSGAVPRRLVPRHASDGSRSHVGGRAARRRHVRVDDGRAHEPLSRARGRRFLIVDDYEFEPCQQAVEDYRNANGITDPIDADRLARRVLAAYEMTGRLTSRRVTRRRRRTGPRLRPALRVPVQGRRPARAAAVWNEIARVPLEAHGTAAAACSIRPVGAASS